MGRLRSRLCVETLEGREVPAGTVTVLGHGTDDITITGDNLANDIQISMNNNGIQIQANGTTTLTLDPNTPGGWIVTNTTTLIVLNPNGTNNLPTLGNLLVNMNQGNDKVSVLQIQTSGNAIFLMGDGDDKLNIAASDIGGNLIIRETFGNDLVVMDAVTVNGDSYVYLTQGNDKCFITSSNFMNDLIINTAGGQDVVRFIPGTVQVNQNLGIYTGGGNDKVIVDNGTSGAATLVVNGNTVIRTHGGDDLVLFGILGATGATVNLKATLIHTGAGNDKIYMRDAIMSLLIALLDSGDDQVINNWGADNVTVGFGSLLDGGPHISGDSLSNPWSAPANLTVVNFP